MVYVSWGGTGRSASVREAMRWAMAAADNDPGLRYLAILDDGAFGDLDDRTRRLVADELEWLLDAQLELMRDQLGGKGLPVEVIVRSGDVIEAVVDLMAERGPADVLIGAPVPVAGHESVESMIDSLAARIKGTVSVVVPPEIV